MLAEVGQHHPKLVRTIVALLATPWGADQVGAELMELCQWDDRLAEAKEAATDFAGDAAMPARARQAAAMLAAASEARKRGAGAAELAAILEGDRE